MVLENEDFRRGQQLWHFPVKLLKMTVPKNVYKIKCMTYTILPVMLIMQYIVCCIKSMPPYFITHSKTVVTCKIKHLQKRLEPSTSRSFRAVGLSAFNVVNYMILRRPSADVDASARRNNSFRYLTLL